MLNRYIGCLTAAFVVIFVAFGPVSAQEKNGGTETAATPQKIQEMTSGMSQEELNALARLLELMAKDKETAAAVTAPKPTIGETVEATWESYKHFLWTNITGLPLAVTGVVKVVAMVFAGRGLGADLIFAANLLLAIAIGYAVELAVNRFTRDLRDRIRHADSSDLASTIRALGLRFALELAGLIAFTLVAQELARFLFADADDRYIATRLILIAVLPVRFMATFLRLMLAPEHPSLRLVSADDWTANFIYRHLTLLTAVVGIGLYLFLLMTRFSIEGVEPLRFWVGLVVYAWLISVTWRAREGLTSIIKGTDEHLSLGLERMAAWWPGLSIAIMVVQYLAVALAISSGSVNFSPFAGAMTISIIVLAPFLDTMLRGVIKHLVPPMQGEGPIAEAAYQKTRQSYARIGRVALLAILVLMIFSLWDVSVQNLAARGMGAQLAANAIGAVFVLIFGYLVWELSRVWFNHQLAKDAPAEGDTTPGEGEGGGMGKSRLATILPLLSVTVQIAIIVITVLVALGQLGVNITPLLAGAGVFGLAIGFGAQTLVKDVVSGVFFLLDDAFRLGEFIDVGGTQGTVEKISVRSLQLRHPNGPVHIIPYGEIPQLTNNSRDYVIMKLRFTVPFETEIEKVRKIFKKIGQQMMEDPELGKDFIAPFKFQGVADVDDVGIVVRGKFTTKPGAQWMVRKKIYAHVQKAFEENGIQFARKEVRVHIPGLEEHEELSEDQKKNITKAASSAASSVL